ncbi:MAG: PDZ domain-containing protein [Thermoanaerobaculia bacterium]|nr:PDZ domain-containing protein [Thermoanaerobaculia bacterium]
MRLTWHPGPDQAVGWSPDGERVLFRSARDNGTRTARLWSVPAAGGWPERLPLPEAYWGTYSPDGTRFAYMPHERFQLSWKRYRGGEATFVWIADLASLEIQAVPRGNSNDSYPAWAEDGRVYFLSDREGKVTLFRYDPATREVARVYANDGLDLKSARPGPQAVVFERFGEIGLYDLASGAVTYPPIRVTPDLAALRPRFAKVGEEAGAGALSPTGARAAFSARGEIFTVPAEKGNPRNLSRSPGAADRDPAWSPDGQTVAWLSDQSGEYALHLAPQSGLGEVRRIPLGDPPSFFYRPLFSPDGARIALTDKRLNLWIVEVATGAMTKVDTGTYDHPERSLDPAWSPDSRYLAYTKRQRSHVHEVFVHDVAAKTSHRLTDGLADARFPVFDPSGKYLWFAASTDFGPTSPWLDMTSVERPVSRSVWLAVLAAGEPSPFAPESDEEKPAEKDEKPAAEKTGGKEKKPAAAEKQEEQAKVTLDLAGIERRIVPVPGLAAKHYQRLAPGKEGILFLLEAPELVDADADEPPAGPLWRYELAKREATRVAGSVAEFEVSHDGGKLLVRAGDSWSIHAAEDELDLDEGELDLDRLEARVDPLAEWRQIYREAWRLQRDFLYDPGFHGLDLAAAERRYAPWVEGLAHRDDLNYLLVEMLGELSLGHVYVGGGDLPQPPRVKGGLLGADWEVADGRYRIARIYSGESWNPDLVAPLDRPGVDARPGDYLIAVEGRELRPPTSLFAAFEATAGREVRLRLAADPEGKGAREVTVVPVENENRLRYRAWVEGNRRRVAERSGGRLGYLHLPNTAGAGFESFNRYFFPQIDREGLVVDERNNGGGLVADYIVEVLGRKLLWAVASREGEPMLSPAGALYGPKVMLINRHAGSGATRSPGCSASSASGHWSAPAPGAAWSGSGTTPT